MNTLKSGSPSQEDLHFLEEMFDKYGHDDSILCCSELDGFLTAVVIGPDMIMPSEWNLAIWGGEELSPEWRAVDEFQRFMDCAIRMMNHTATTLMDCCPGAKRLSP